MFTFALIVLALAIAAPDALAAIIDALLNLLALAVCIILAGAGILLALWLAFVALAVITGVAA